MTTGERIRLARQKAGLTQKELGSQLGISYVGISMWEAGKRHPKFATLEKMANALQIDVKELIDPSFYYNSTSSSDRDKVLNVLGTDNTEPPEKEEIELMQIKNSFLLLNEQGRKKALEYLKDLRGLTRYQRRAEEDVKTEEDDS